MASGFSLSEIGTAAGSGANTGAAAGGVKSANEP